MTTQDTTTDTRPPAYVSERAARLAKRELHSGARRLRILRAQRRAAEDRQRPWLARPEDY